MLVAKPEDECVAGPGPQWGLPMWQYDSHLGFPLEPRERAYFAAWLRVRGTEEESDIKIAPAVPPQAELFWTPISGLHHGPLKSVIASNEHPANSAIAWAVVNGVRNLYLFGCVVNWNTPGELRLTWAQNKITTSPITVCKHSCLYKLEVSNG